MTEQARPIRDAATAILYREGLDGRGEVFMVKRHGKSGFMAGAHVFPGGTLEDDDAPLAASLGVTTPRGREGVDAFSSALLVAALRETFEESAILPGVDWPLEVREALRRKLLEKTLTFSQVLDELQCDVQVFSSLIPWSRWVTPVVERRRFDARFFLVDLRGSAQQEGRQDGIETTSAEWLGIEEALESAESGRIWMAPPTSHTLMMLRDQGPDFNHPLSAIQPEFFDLERPTLVLPGHERHSLDSGIGAGPSAFEFVNKCWVPVG